MDQLCGDSRRLRIIGFAEQISDGCEMSPCEKRTPVSPLAQMLRESHQALPMLGLRVKTRTECGNANGIAIRLGTKTADDKSQSASSSMSESLPIPCPHASDRCDSNSMFPPMTASSQHFYASRQQSINLLVQLHTISALFLLSLIHI